MTAATETVHEIVELTEEPGPLLHAYCEVCRHSAPAGTKVKAMCGGGVGVDASDPPERLIPIPEDTCVVCAELAPRPCERCGW